ncbi:MAG: solute:sodium symporter family transporter [Lachnospiraceae bacterium]|nr:solute:sodium symporter family transporter [Lachnospiraceae bacterium]
MLTAIEFVLFTVFVAVLSWWKTRDEKLDTEEGYFVAGHSLPGIVIAGSLMMTNLSAEQLVGTNGQAFSGSMATMAWEATSAFALIILAFVLLPKFLRGNISTIPQFYEMRYDTFTMRMFSVMFLFAYVVTMLPTILYSGSVALEKIFDIQSMLNLNYFTAILIVCFATGIIGMCYSVFGGLKAVAYSDTINGVGLLIGGFMVPVLGFIALGKLDGGGLIAGIQHFATATPEKMNAWSSANAMAPYIPWPLLFTGMFVNNMFYWSTNQSIIQRSLGAKNLAEAQKGAIWAGFFKCLDVFVIVIPGIIAYQLMQAGVLTIGSGASFDGDSAYPLLVMHVMPKVFMGFFAAVMFGAILSSFNSVLNSASTIFSLNIWKPIWGKNADAKKVVKVGQIFGLIVGILGILISPFIMYFGSGIMNFINECWGLFSMPILCAVLFGMLNKKVSPIAPKIGVPVHIVMYAIGYLFVFEHIHYLYWVFVCFLVQCVIYFAVAKFAPLKEDFEMPDVPAIDMSNWKTGKAWAIAGVLVVVVMYLIFSPLVLG